MNKLAENIDDTFEENSTPVASKEELNADDFEVEVVDDTPEQDRVAKRKEPLEPEVETEDEARNYSDNVQKRISKLKYDYHEERRAKEEATRLQDEAVSFAENLKK